jgi:hypothetical protein
LSCRRDRQRAMTPLRRRSPRRTAPPRSAPVSPVRGRVGAVECSGWAASTRLHSQARSGTPALDSPAGPGSSAGARA